MILVAVYFGIAAIISAMVAIINIDAFGTKYVAGRWLLCVAACGLLWPVYVYQVTRYVYETAHDEFSQEEES